MSLYSCESGDGTWLGYRERIMVSPRPEKCDESHVTIPAGTPFALCQLAWTMDEDEFSCDASEFPPGSRIVETRAGYVTPEVWRESLSSHVQCLEVWRYLRGLNRRHGACAMFGAAVEAYELEAEDREPVHIHRYLGLMRAIRTARERYAAGGKPRLHPAERESLESGRWCGQLPWDLSDPCAFDGEAWGKEVVNEEEEG